MSQVFFRILESLHGLDPKRGSIVAYAIAAARRLVSDYHAAHHIKFFDDVAVTSLEQESRGPLERLLSTERSNALRAELETLPNETRELLILRFVDELRYAEIAQVLELTEAAVRQRVSRAMRELRATWAARWDKGELVR